MVDSEPLDKDRFIMEEGAKETASAQTVSASERKPVRLILF